MKVSCVIRTLNEAELLHRCITTLREQQGDHETEFVVVDSGSTDETTSIAKGLGAKLLFVDKQPLKEFDYSRALNLGIAATTGDYVVSISAHAIPTTSTWLLPMLSHFSDDRVVGVYSRQEPWPHAVWTELARIQRQFSSASRVFEGEALDSEMRFSNVASVFRKSTWNQCRFTLPAGEDRDWAQRMLNRGCRIVYEAGTAVYHSHNESVRNRARRAVNLARSEDRALGRARTLPRTLKELAGSIKTHTGEIYRLEASLPQKCLYEVSAIVQAGWYAVEMLGTTESGSSGIRVGSSGRT